MKNMSKGMSLLDTCIVAACISLITVLVLPVYRVSKGRELIRELEKAAESRVAAIERAIAIYENLDISQLDADELGIPSDVIADTSMHGASVKDGKIIMTWRTDTSFLQGVTYELEPDNLTLPVVWNVGGTCRTLGMC